MHTEGRGLKEVMAEQEAALLPSHVCDDDGGGEIQKDRGGKREEVERARMWLLRGRTRGIFTELHRALKSESIQIPPKTTSDSYTCECLQTGVLIPSPNSPAIVPRRPAANTQVIDSDGC